MRTTVTLDPDAEALLRRRMREAGVSFKQALNDAIRQSQAPAAPSPPYRTATADMGRPTVNLDRALRLAGEIEDEELLRRIRLGK
ncbi:MAG: antitoxin [Actinomycetota bacterium]